MARRFAQVQAVDLRGVDEDDLAALANSDVEIGAVCGANPDLDPGSGLRASSLKMAVKPVDQAGIPPEPGLFSQLAVASGLEIFFGIKVTTDEPPLVRRDEC